MYDTRPKTEVPISMQGTHFTLNFAIEIILTNILSSFAAVEKRGIRIFRFSDGTEAKNLH